MTISSPVFTRDRFTWLAYLMLGYYAYLQAGLGPLMPFLSTELHLNYTVSGLHLSAFALGMVLSGVSGDRIVGWLGRPAVFWGGGLGMAGGGLLLIVGQHPVVTIAAALLMGIGGSWTLVVIQAALSDRHQERRASALTESNIIASVFAACVPLLVGIGQRSGFTWRLAIIAAMALLGVLFLIFRREPLPVETSAADVQPGQKAQALPRIFWMYWLVVFLSVSIEWSVIFWGAALLEYIGLTKIDAATAMSVFFIAMIVGRFIGSRLTRRARSASLLVVAVVIVIAGWLVFWSGATIPVHLGGLFLLGLGMANMFPLSLSAAVNLIPAQSNRASARVASATGTAMLIVPQVLGVVADRSGILNAFNIVAVFVVLVSGMVIIAWRSSR